MCVMLVRIYYFIDVEDYFMVIFFLYYTKKLKICIDCTYGNSKNIILYLCLKMNQTTTKKNAFDVDNWLHNFILF